jgi:biopolymer transport protein ExbD
MAVNEQQVTLEELDLILRMRLNRSYEKHVIIRADQDSIHGNLLLTMRKAKEFGAKSIAIATEPKNANVVQEDLE